MQDALANRFSSKREKSKVERKTMQKGIAKVVDGNQIMKITVDQFNELLRKSGEVERELAVEADRKRILKRLREAGLNDITTEEIVRGEK